MSGWLSYLFSPAVSPSQESGGFGDTRLGQYFAKGHTLLSKGQPFPFGRGGIYGPPEGGLLGGGTTTPPDGGGGGGPPAPPPAARWAFPQYTQDWAFTPPTPVWYPDPPKFDKSKYPQTTPKK